MTSRSRASIFVEIVLSFALLFLFVFLMLGSVLALLQTELFGITMGTAARWVAGAILFAGGVVIAYVVRTGHWIQAKWPPNEK